MAHYYKKESTHFQRAEEVNLGLMYIASTGWFRKGFNSYMAGEPIQEMKQQFIKTLNCQTAYELGRLFAAWCKSQKIVINQWYQKTGKFVVHQNVINQVMKARNKGVFC